MIQKVGKDRLIRLLDYRIPIILMINTMRIVISKGNTKVPKQINCLGTSNLLSC